MIVNFAICIPRNASHKSNCTYCEEAKSFTTGRFSYTTLAELPYAISMKTCLCLWLQKALSSLLRPSSPSHLTKTLHEMDSGKPIRVLILISGQDNSPAANKNTALLVKYLGRYKLLHSVQGVNHALFRVTTIRRTHEQQISD